MTDDRIKELANKWRLYPTDHAWDEVLGFAYDLLAAKREWVGLTDEDFYGQSELQVMAMKYAEAKLKEKNT